MKLWNYDTSKEKLCEIIQNVSRNSFGCENMSFPFKAD